MAGKIQKQDIKTEAELISGGGTAADLPNDTQIYVTSGGINKTLDDAIADGDITTGAILADGTVPFTADQSMGGFKLTNLATPASGTDAATKDYVDTSIPASGNFAISAVDLVSTSSLTLSGEQTIDGVLTSGSRVLLTYQNGNPSDPTNGVYLTSSGAWSRVADMNASSEFYSGMNFQVRSGTVWAKSRWFLDTADPITLGVTGLSYLPQNVTLNSSGVGTGGFRITSGPGEFGGGTSKQLIIRNDNAGSNSVFTLSTSNNQATATLKIPSVSGTSDEFLTIKSGPQIGIVNKRFDGDSTNPNRTFNWYYPDPETFGAGFGGDPGVDGAWNATFFNSSYPRFRKGGNLGVNRFEQRHLAVETISTSNITLSGEQTINGVLTSGSRVLVAGQTTASQNGLYKTASGAWARIGTGADAANTNADGSISEDYYAGLQIYVNGGTYVNTIWYCTTTAAITLGTTSLSFKTASPVTYEATSAGGAATETLTFTGLAAGDTILSVSQRVDGGNGTPILGWANQTTNALDVTWTADPTAGAIVRIAVLKA